MFWFRHPQALLSTKAVAMQVVARKAQAMRDTRVIIVEKPKPDGDPVMASARAAKEPVS